MSADKELRDLISERFPGKMFIKPKEAAEIMGVNIKTVIAAIERKHNPLPARNISNGIKNKSYIIPITELCKWGMGMRVK
jgi:hypothetical protein